MTRPTPPRPTYLTVNEAAKLLRVSGMTIRRLMEAGELRGYRFGRVVRIDVRDFDNYVRTAGLREPDGAA